MAEARERSYQLGGSSDDSYLEKMHVEPIYEAFRCPLTKKIMYDPVTIENGQTFEREAIENWFKECQDSGRRPFCPITLKELNSTDLNPSIALRSTIGEWTKRNEAAHLDITSRALTPGNSESDILQALEYIIRFCLKNRCNKLAVRNAELIPQIADMLKNSSKKIRCKALETLRMVAGYNSDTKVVNVDGFYCYC